MSKLAIYLPLNLLQIIQNISKTYLIKVCGCLLLEDYNYYGKVLVKEFLKNNEHI